MGPVPPEKWGRTSLLLPPGAENPIYATGRREGGEVADNVLFLSAVERTS